MRGALPDPERPASDAVQKNPVGTSVGLSVRSSPGVARAAPGPDATRMPQRRKYPDIEVRAGAVNLFLAAFDVFPSLAQRYLISRGFARLNHDGKLRIEKSFIPLDLWLETFDAVMKDIGQTAIFQIGRNGVKNPHFPPSVQDIRSALQEIDMAYHLSHRKGGVSMLDRITGQMLEGIGHYVVRKGGTEERIEVHSDTPYPCPAEHGLVTGIAMLFEPRAVVTHDPSQCRLHGGKRCLYVVSW